MRFALTSLDLETVTPHAGRCRSFLVFEAEAGVEPVKVKDLHLAEDQIFHVFESDGPHPLDEVKVVLCQEDAQASCCARDGGRPSGAALQEEASNCHELLRSKAAVVNVMVKRRGCDRVMYGSGRRAQANLR